MNRPETSIVGAMARIVAVALLALPFAACGATETPASTASDASASGAAHSSPTTYTAQVFLPGMQVTVPDRRWIVFEDQPGEFNLSAPEGVTSDVHVHFWVDPHATAARGVALHGIGRSPQALVQWLRHDPDLVVSAPVERRIAGVTASSVDLDLSATAPREDPSCPGPCLTYLGFRARTTALRSGPAVTIRSGSTSQRCGAVGGRGS